MGKKPIIKIIGICNLNYKTDFSCIFGVHIFSKILRNQYMFFHEPMGSLEAWLVNIVLSPLQEEYSLNAVLSNAVKMFKCL